MSLTLVFSDLVSAFHERLDQLPDYRRGSHTTYSIKDAALGAFAVFFTQSPSFLAHQRQMQAKKGRSNAQTLFRIEQTPTDPQICNLLDPICPSHLYPLFRLILGRLEQAGELAALRDFQDT
jgi:hypothetical protein